MSAACCDSIGVCARPGQHDAVADALDLDIGVRCDLPERGAHAVEVAGDGDVIGGDLAAGGVEEHDVGLADRGADDIGALRRADHGVGDLGIADQHVLDLARQVDHDRLADAERQEARVHGAGRRGRHGGRWRGAIVAGDDRRQHRVERQRGDGRIGQGAGEERPHRQPIHPAFHVLHPHRCAAVEGAMAKRASPVPAAASSRTINSVRVGLMSAGRVARHAAMPPVLSAMVRTTMRAVFIRFTFHKTPRRFRRRVVELTSYSSKHG